MKANKIIVEITTETLSIDCLKSLLSQVIGQIENENENGMLNANDGDSVKWKTTHKLIEF